MHIENQICTLQLGIKSAHPKTSMNLFKKSNFLFMNFSLENAQIPRRKYSNTQYDINFYCFKNSIIIK